MPPTAEQQNETRLSSLLAEIILFLADELKSARKDRLSEDDIQTLADILHDQRRRTRKLEALDAQTPPLPPTP